MSVRGRHSHGLPGGQNRGGAGRPWTASAALDRPGGTRGAGASRARPIPIGGAMRTEGAADPIVCLIGSTRGVDTSDTLDHDPNLLRVVPRWFLGQSPDP